MKLSIIIKLEKKKKGKKLQQQRERPVPSKQSTNYTVNISIAWKQSNAQLTYVQKEVCIYNVYQ